MPTAGQTKGEGKGPARVVASPKVASTPPPLMSQRGLQGCRGETSQGNKNANKGEERGKSSLRRDNGLINYRNKLLENRWNTSCKIFEEFAPKSLKNFLQNR